MQTLVIAAALLFIENFIGAEPRTSCPSRCEVSRCPSPSCPSGYVPDRCNCCLVCASAEGDPCGRKEDLPCGDGLECRHPAGKRLSKGVCQCKMGHKVCGSDGKTYGNVCQLKAVSRKALQRGLPTVSQAHKGSCEKGSSTGLSFVFQLMIHPAPCTMYKYINSKCYSGFKETEISTTAKLTPHVCLL